MAFNGGYGEVGDLGVGDIFLVLDVVDERTESCSENYGGVGHCADFRSDILSCFLNFG